ncbi:thioredoxin family protein [Bacillus sp. ISL-57]|uniref:thioredoxin family protein n=1 Tax=Bacillus sp. ISL-57 TaxID=2819135 RepID=UPI001BE84E67|nr:thioredoxin family protein [Bacillus sp. ISL-57]MBT2717481.1 thioredoxin family protein [Bacillus sp. ISL-57]
MKKIIIFSTILLCSIAAMIFIIQDTRADKPLYTNISIEDYKNKLENKDSFVMYVYSTSCPACQSFKPVLNEFIKENNSKVLALNTAVKENNDPTFFKENDLQHTPTLIIYKEGIQTNIEVGFLSKKELTSFLDY